MDEPVRVEPREGFWRLVLDRADRLNAFDRPMHGALAAALDRAAADRDCRAVLLTGAGRGFCAGQDLAAVEGEVDLGRLLAQTWNPLVRRLRELPVPTVAAVNGIAAGAGVALALACDLVLAAKSARFFMAFAKLALIPDAGASWHLPRLVGPARARALALLGDPLPAEEAERTGLIWRAVEDATLEAEAEAAAARLAQGPTAALVATRRLLEESWSRSLEEHLEEEARLQGELGRASDYAEGVRAFLEKRPARFGARP
ncbi:MAG: enoyl-CoA hydratase-related protein [Geminicoccaceae bacterium]|nr:enoyl-CoA hydratase-related protein [Geminicoccaceae bacterium]MDW8369325.1 enoyl-CoA hydratase-related protein [Geminicoccaceae bacterium]